MRSESTDVSIKNLLKQVYAAHTTKVKCLEDEIEELKNRLCETEKKLKEHDSECKRCTELEEAFTTCKAALEEQTKWFENFGQKFSIFNSSDNKIKNVESSKTSKLQDNMQMHNEISFCPDVLQLNQTEEKSSVTKATLLKNLMSLTPDKIQNSLDLCTVQFPGNVGPSFSSLNFDSVILAPDTADIILDANKDVKQSSVKGKVIKNSEQLNEAKDKPKNYEERSNFSKKRTCSNSSGSNTSPNKKLNKGAQNASSDEKRLTEKEIVKKKESNVERHIKSDLVENLKAKQLNNTTIDLLDIKVHNNNKLTNTDNKEKVISDLENKKDTDTEESIKIPIFIEENDRTKLEHTNTKDCTSDVSPSILPPSKKNGKLIIQNQPMLAEDINDFQVPPINKNPPEMVDVWKTSEKKIAKKGSGIKGVKLTSKFKMSLDALPPNYKKPNLRQTKLSKSIFQPKSTKSEDHFIIEAKKILSDSNNSSVMSSKNSSANKNNKTSTIDFDATCIPENFKFNAESCDEDEESILLIQHDSSDESLGSLNVSPKTKNKNLKNEGTSKENKEKAKFEDFLLSENLNSFDRLPKKEEPNYKYKEETIRKKSERKQLNGFECKECEKYFADLGLSDEEKRERLNKCSRHRAKFPAPATPEHFWELDFPDTQECKARGYLNETQKVTLKTHRRRPL